MPKLRIKRRDPNLISGMQIELQPGHGPQHRPSAYMDNARIREEVGYCPEYTIERAITEYIDWLRTHPAKIVSGFTSFFANSSAKHPLFTRPMVVLWIA